MEEKTEAAVVEYEKPQIRDYGDLKDLTATGTAMHHTDVPFGTPVPPFSIFS